MKVIQTDTNDDLLIRRGCDSTKFFFSIRRRMGEEKQFGAVNGKPDSDGSNNTKIHGWSKSDFTSNGNLVIFCFCYIMNPVVQPK